MGNQEAVNLSELTAEIISAYVSNNSVKPEELATLIGDVHSALQRAPNAKAEPASEPKQPAVPIKKSVTPDYIISLEDGRKFKSLKRHLKNTYGLTPDEYRAKWSLPRDYPMVAPNYAKSRSELAKSMGLGRKASNPDGQGGQEDAAEAATQSSTRRSRAKVSA